MLTAHQMHTFFMLQRVPECMVSVLPKELIFEIGNCVQDSDGLVAKALHHAAYAQKEDVQALIAMLEENPRLLLQAGDVITPGGYEILRVTPYEFLLGAGDYELAEIVQGYFSKIENGEKSMYYQYERYRTHIEGILTQQPYDLAPLIELIKKATPGEISALLNKDMSGEGELCKAMIQFRRDWAPKALTKPCMHYNYASLKHAFELLDREWYNLCKASNDNYNKVNLVWRQLIGFEMRRMPGIDRCVMAQGLHYVIEDKTPVARTYTLTNGGVLVPTFPVTVADDSIDGLGGDFAINVFARRARGTVGPTRISLLWGLMSNKNFKLAELMQPHPTHQPSWCVML